MTFTPMRSQQSNMYSLHQGENSTLEKFACVHRKKKNKERKKNKLVVTSETVKSSSGRNR